MFRRFRRPPPELWSTMWELGLDVVDDDVWVICRAYKRGIFSRLLTIECFELIARRR